MGGETRLNHDIYMKRSKRYKQIAEKIEEGKIFSLTDGLELIKEMPVKFDAGVEVHIRLGVDPKQSSQVVKSVVVFPNGTGKTKRVAAFVSPDKEAEAKEAGADVIADDSVIEEIKNTGKCDFDVAVATPDMMKKLGPIARVLGQQGLMPTPKTDTVGTDVAKMVSELKAGKMAFRSDDSGNVHALVGKVSFDTDKLAENIRTFVDEVKRAKPDDAKGTYIKSVSVSSSMGPGVPVTVE